VVQGVLLTVMVTAIGLLAIASRVAIGSAIPA
jgi:hypothetical protein